jgi:hypothetical protein
VARLSGPYLVREYDEAVLTDLMARLTPENMITMVVAKTFQGKTTLTEPW